MKASAYSGPVAVDVAVVEHDCATPDSDTTSALPNKGGARFWSVRGKFMHRGDGVVSCVGSDQLRGNGTGHGGVFGGVCD